jgi:hypothetical protein
MSVQMNDLQIMYNALSIFLFNNFKKMRKDFKKEIKKIYEYKESLNKDIYNIVDDIINNSCNYKKKSLKNIDKNINNNDNEKNIPDGYKLCLKQRTKNRGYCKKKCKINEDGCFFHKSNSVNIDQIPKNVNKKENNYIKDDHYLDIEIKCKKDNRRKKIYIPNGINNFSLENNYLELSKNQNNINSEYIDFPTIQQTQIPGQCFKNNNKLYTVNYYKKEVIADAPNGIPCYFCGIKRYTQSGPCINYNCKNKKR